MRCGFCYIPFDRREGSQDTASRVVEILADWEVDSITFGGGDPLMYDYVFDLIDDFRSRAKSDTFIQLDTNGLLLHEQSMPMLDERVDLLGIPLDSVSEEVAWKMRRHRQHPESINGLLQRLRSRGTRVKVNTVVTPDNLAEVPKIGEVIADSGAAIWSVYEYWPIPEAMRRFHVETDEYCALAADLVAQFPEVNIEIEPVSSRWPGYFFVTQTGRSYTVDPGNTQAYLELGDLLAEPQAVLARWVSVCDSTANLERWRRRSRPERV